MSINAHALVTGESSLKFENNSTGRIILGSDSPMVIEPKDQYKKVILLWGSLDIHSTVEEVIVVSGRVQFKKGSKITKSLTLMGGSYEVESGADVKVEQIAFQKPGILLQSAKTALEKARNSIGTIAKIIGIILGLFFLWIIGLFVFFFFPSFSKSSSVLFSQGLKNCLAAFLGFLAIPILSVLLVISIIGILLLPFWFFFLLLTFVFGYLSAALWVGSRVVPNFKRYWAGALRLFVGILLLQIIWWTDTYLGDCLFILFCVLGWGNTLRYLRRSLR
ncbi:MAG: hypothetical protein M9962_11310 [Oligoflexia bacterium]|nr:hypothetical protein [Oligoflexia bacterium]